jgi:hypothetical protein
MTLPLKFYSNSWSFRLPLDVVGLKVFELRASELLLFKDGIGMPVLSRGDIRRLGKLLKEDRFVFLEAHPLMPELLTFCLMLPIYDC